MPERRKPPGSTAADRRAVRSGSRTPADGRGIPVRRAPDGSVLLRAGDVGALQRLAGNSAVSRMVSPSAAKTSALPAIQREFDDQGQAGSGELGVPGPVSQPNLAEGGGGGGELIADGMSEFGEYDGRLSTGTEVRAMVDRGQVATGKWHHAGGIGGKGNENTGTSTVVAPVYESSPAPAAGGTAKAWVRKGTGKVTVTRSWNGVVGGDNGTAIWAGSGGGLVFIMWSAVLRMAQHERGHVKQTKRFHDSDIKPMEARVKDKKTGATEADAITAMQTHVNWNATLAGFATKDTAMNGAGATFDTTDSAKADFYHNKGPKKIKKVNYQHFIEAP